MTSRRFREEGLLFVGSLSNSMEIYSSALPLLRENFGALLFESPPLPWNFSDYYNEEMGAPLFRNFIFFDQVIDTAVLPEAKLKTMEIEAAFSENGRRRINLDPGYLTMAKVVLASHKNYSHRINLGKAVFAELELIYEKNGFQPMPYTYKDYRDMAFLDFFMRARELLKKILEARA